MRMGVLDYVNWRCRGKSSAWRRRRFVVGCVTLRHVTSVYQQNCYICRHESLTVDGSIIMSRHGPKFVRWDVVAAVRGTGLLLVFVRQQVRELSSLDVSCVWTAGRSLRELVVRRNAIVQRSDWSKAHSWTNEFYRHLRSAALSYDETERQISRLLDTRWMMLSDRLFRQVHVWIHIRLHGAVTVTWSQLVTWRTNNDRYRTTVLVCCQG